MKTHKVLDIAMLDELGVFSGTQQECINFVGNDYGYQIVPLTKEELEVEHLTVEQ